MTHRALPQHIRVLDGAAFHDVAVASVTAGAICAAVLIGASLGTAARAAIASQRAPTIAVADEFATTPGSISGRVLGTAVAPTGHFSTTAMIETVDRSAVVLSMAGTFVPVNLLGTRIHGLFVGATDLSGIDGALVRLDGSCGPAASACSIANVEVIRIVGHDNAPLPRAVPKQAAVRTSLLAAAA